MFFYIYAVFKVISLILMVKFAKENERKFACVIVLFPVLFYLIFKGDPTGSIPFIGGFILAYIFTNVYANNHKFGLAVKTYNKINLIEFITIIFPSCCKAFRLGFMDSAPFEIYFLFWRVYQL